MAADHAPRIFAVVLEYGELEYGEQIDAQIVAWGLALDDGAYMTTVDGRNQYAMTTPESALKYVGARADTAARVVWVGATQEELPHEHFEQDILVPASIRREAESPTRAGRTRLE